nr:MAG: pseudouridine synthase [Vulcanisaeta sp. AZ3]
MNIEKAMEILRKYPLCDHCLGRLFARLGVGLSNDERGRAIKDYLLMSIHERIMSSEASEDLINDLKALALSGHEPSIKLLKGMGIEVNPVPCYVCGGSIFNRLDEWARSIADALSRLNVEFNTFRLGSKIPIDVLRRELEISAEFNIASAESIKRELNRELGKRVSAITGKPFSREKPDLEVVIDTASGSLNIQLMPIYLFTRYRKIHRVTSKRRIKWPIESIIRIFGAQGILIHSGGDEAGNVRVLGNGRPMVLQIIRPSKRPSINDVIKMINNDGFDVVFNGLSEVRAFTVRRVKDRVRDYIVTYRALVMVNGQVSEEALRSLRDYFRNRQVVQRLRVGGRVRRRVGLVYELDGRVIGEGLVEFLIRCQGNLSVKGFIHGLYGDVEPSISGMLGVEARPIEIDILNIID